MTDDTFSLDNQWLALVRMQPDLPALAGPELAPEMRSILTYLAPSDDETTRMVAAVDLHRKLASYPAVRQRFTEELHLQVALQTLIEDDVVKATAALGLDERTRLRATAAALILVHGDLVAPLADTELPRLVKLGVGGTDGGQVIRLRNLMVDFGSLGELAAGTFLTGADMLGMPNPLIIAAGIILIIRSLHQGTTATLDTDEASVFWGFIQACGRDQRTSFDEIVAVTNQERARYQLGAMAKGEVAAALNTLAQVGALRQQGEEWVLTDRYEITG